MPRVKCPAASCIYWDEGYCSAEEIELDPEALSCITFEELADIELDEDELDEDWEEEDDEYSLEALEEQENHEEGDEW